MPASTTVGQRFRQLIQHLGLSKNAFALSLDRTATVIQHVVEERNKPGYDLLCRVVEVYPNVALPWLLLGQGPMLTDSAAASAAPTADPADDFEPAEAPPLPRAPRRLNGTLQPADIAATLALANGRASAPGAVPTATPKAQASAAAAETLVVVAPAAAEAAPLTPAPAVPEVAPPAPAAPLAPDASALAVFLHMQGLQHQLALAELRNQHLLEQQQLLRELLEATRRGGV